MENKKQRAGFKAGTYYWQAAPNGSFAANSRKMEIGQKFQDNLGVFLLSLWTDEPDWGFLAKRKERTRFAGLRGGWGGGELGWAEWVRLLICKRVQSFPFPASFRCFSLGSIPFDLNQDFQTICFNTTITTNEQ